MYPAIMQAQTTQNPPSVGAPLVREGDFAVALQQALGVGTFADEIEAETRLGNLSIGPNNGWIADYPVTPDILGEIEDSIGTSADAGQLPIGREEALKRLNAMSSQMGLAVAPYTAGATYQGPMAESYPNPGFVNNYYYTEGPPIVTYYTPPPDYYPLYTWVPYPFFASGFFFNGFFVLNDFHRHVFVHGRRGHPAFVSNHFRDIRDHRVFRVDPGHRFEGRRTFAGIGAPPRRGFIATGVPRSGANVFNAPVNQFGPRMAGPGFGHEGRIGGGFGGRGGGFGGHRGHGMRG